LEKKTRKVQDGTVISNKMDKTVVVLVERHTQHPLYKRTVKRSQKFMAHDEENTCRTGDRVEIIESRPHSKRKKWRVRKILERAERI